MELLQLRYFHEVAQTQHMTNSAKRLGVAQPALTQAIRRLEGELDAKLFERAGRNIRLTPCGEALEAKVAPLLAAFDEIPLAIAQAKGQERDTVRIDVEAATSMTVDAIAVFRATVPQAAFVINQANSEARWDVRVRTVTPGGGGKPDARTSQVFRERICLAIPKEQAKGKSVCLADFADAPFVCLAGTRGFRGVCDELCLKAGSHRTWCSSPTARCGAQVHRAWFGRGFFGLNAAGVRWRGRMWCWRPSRIPGSRAISWWRRPSTRSVRKPPSSTRFCWSS